MDSRWLKGHSNREARKKQVKDMDYAFDEIIKLLEKEYKKKPADRDYTNPNWMASQIAINEYNQAVDDIIKLLTIKE
jgi:hypothetical protein